MYFSPQVHAIFRHQNFKKCSNHAVFCTFWLENALFATATCNFSTSELQKVVPDPQFFNILTSKCASRHSGVQFFDIRTSKSAPKLTLFLHFHFKMRFSPQRRGIFRHPNFKKWSEAGVFCTCSLRNAFFATAACNFWFLCWAPSSAPAALTGLLFDWPDTRIIEKTQHFATSLTFGADVSSFFWLSRYCIFFLLTWLLYSAFQLSILSEVCYLNFLRIYNILLWLCCLEETRGCFWFWPLNQCTKGQETPLIKSLNIFSKFFTPVKCRKHSGQGTFKVICPSPLSKNSKRLSKSWYSSSNWPGRVALITYRRVRDQQN